MNYFVMVQDEVEVCRDCFKVSNTIYTFEADGDEDQLDRNTICNINCIGTWYEDNNLEDYYDEKEYLEDNGYILFENTDIEMLVDDLCWKKV